MLLFLGLSAESVAAIAIKCLAVGGAFLVGFVLFGAIVFALDRWLFGKKTPSGMKRAARLIGGVAAAVFAAFVLFGSGGNGLFGNGAGTGSGTPEGSPAATAPDKAATPVPTPVVTPSDVPATDAVIHVMVLGGEDVKAERFYRVDDDPQPKAFEDLKRTVLARKPDGTRKLAIVLQFPAQNAPARDHPAVIQLERWATEQAGLGVFQPAKK